MQVYTFITFYHIFISVQFVFYINKGYLNRMGFW